MTEVAPTDIEIAPAAVPAKVSKPKLATMTLLRNYAPAGEYEVVGHNRPAVMRKDATGKPVETMPAMFIEGEAMPPPTPGTGTGRKVWAGTVVRIGIDEAKTMKRAGIGEVEVD